MLIWTWRPVSTLQMNGAHPTKLNLHLHRGCWSRFFSFFLPLNCSSNRMVAPVKATAHTHTRSTGRCIFAQVSSPNKRNWQQGATLTTQCCWSVLAGIHVNVSYKWPLLIGRLWEVIAWTNQNRPRVWAAVFTNEFSMQVHSSLNFHYLAYWPNFCSSTWEWFLICERLYTAKIIFITQA